MQKDMLVGVKYCRVMRANVDNCQCQSKIVAEVRYHPDEKKRAVVMMMVVQLSNALREMFPFADVHCLVSRQ